MAKPGTLCHQCIGDIQKRLDQLPKMRDGLRTFLNMGMKVSYESKVHATKEPAAPINIHVLDLLDEVDEAPHLAEGRPIEDLVRQPATAWITADEKTIYLDGVDRALRIRKTHQKALDTLGLEPVWHRRVAPCPQCGLPCLGQWSGEDEIKCSNEDCLAVMSKQQYEDYCADGK